MQPDFCARKNILPDREMIRMDQSRRLDGEGQ